jgi:hypothetical protein
MEKILFLTVNEASSFDAKLFLKFIEDDVFLALEYKDRIISKTADNFNEGLLGIFEEAPQIMSFVFWERADTTSGFVDVKITIVRKYDQPSDEYVLYFTLQSSLHGNQFEVTAGADFSLALQRLVNQMQIELKLCAYCKYADYKAYGNEELWQDWYCFREIGLSDQPWYEREPSFLLAIPHVSAFHWCPKFEGHGRSIF